MITKQEFVDNILFELDILKHLATKIDPAKLSYKPTEVQRTTLELMQYLSHWPSTAVLVAREGGFDPYTEPSNKSLEVDSPEKFIEALDREKKLVVDYMATITDQMMEEGIDLFKNGFPQKRSLILTNMLLKMLPAYKMQLFLYIKASGNLNIGTSNLWMGRDK